MIPNPLESALLSLGTQLITQLVNQSLADPDSLMQVAEALFGKSCHTAHDVCQDILDAMEHGYISREKGLAAINLILSADSPSKSAKPVDLPNLSHDARWLNNFRKELNR